jgi:hypothetical protein
VFVNESFRNASEWKDLGEILRGCVFRNQKDAISCLLQAALICSGCMLARGTLWRIVSSNLAV